MGIYRLTEAAEDDIVDILEWSESNFGEAARRRYERLIVTALTDIAADPNRLGGVSQPELGEGARPGWFCATAKAFHHLLAGRQGGRDGAGRRSWDR